DAAPDPEGQALVMKRAMNDAEVTPVDVDYLNAHGTSTPYNDRTETQAIKLAFGEAAGRLRVSSTKSMTGHLIAGAGGVEAVASILALHHSFVPPTINYETPDPDCDLDITPNTAVETTIDIAMSNSFGMGGQNACAVFKRYE